MSLLQPVPSTVEGTECQEKIFDEFETAKCDEKKRIKKVCVITNGCPENRIDCSRMQKFLGDNGCTITADIKNADIVVFNSCGLTHATQEFSVKIIKHIQALKKPSAELVVCGCLPRINMPRLKEVHQGFTFQHEIEQLKEVIETQTNPQDSCANHLSPRAHVPIVRRWRIPDLKKIFSLMSIKEKLTESYYDRLDREINVFRSHSFCIKVSTGCLNTCAYCAVRISRGELKSKPVDRIIEEFEEGLAKGYKEFALLGTDVGAYGRDLPAEPSNDSLSSIAGYSGQAGQGKTLVDLLRELTKKEGDYTIRIRNIQPRFLLEMLPELREILRSGKISYLSSAAQSGNNRILGLMRRGYKIEDYKEAILSLKREFPKLQIRTQIMVGFPSETEEEFEDSLRLLDEIDYDFVEVYQFQPRPNTEAAAMKDQVPAKISRRRFHKAYMKAISNLRKKRP
jgi:threonylcarbamoyladenosine tRNA methylthiotransferase CDKAL1